MIKSLIQIGFQFILDIFFPKYCLVCKATGNYLCEKCLGELKLLNIQKCPKCHRQNKCGDFCSKTCQRNFSFDQLIVCLDYQKSDLIKKLIALFKYKFSEELAGNFAKMMSKQVENFYQLNVDLEYRIESKKILIIPVPLHKKRLRYRGFNQSLLLAEGLLDLFRFNVEAQIELRDCLMRKIYTKEQAKLNRLKRLTNLLGTIALKEEYFEERYKNFFTDKSVILIDDVATTLSTLNECSKVLKAAGVKHICGLVLARA